MTQDELLAVAELVERSTKRLFDQAADLQKEHDRKKAEHRAAFGARTSADAKIIDGLRSDLAAERAVVKDQSDAAKNAGKLLGWTPNESAFQAAQRVVKERDGLLIQVQDQRAEIERLSGEVSLHSLLKREYDKALMLCESEDQTPEECIISLSASIDNLQGTVGELTRDRDAHRAEVADLRGIIAMVQASLGIKPGDHIVQAIEALRSLSPKYKVGDKLESNRSVEQAADHDTPAGKEAAEVALLEEIKVGDKVRLCREPTPAPQQSGLGDCPWNKEWGAVGDIAEVINVLFSPSPVAVRLESELVVWWPRSCIEVVRKEAAESASEIKLGDVVEVVSDNGMQTWESDIGSMGKVVAFETTKCVRLMTLPDKRNALGGYVSLCDVRKVPQ